MKRVQPRKGQTRLLALVGFCYGSGATIIINLMARLLWGAIKDKARSERCEG